MALGMKSYGLYLFDLDGTIYRGRQALPHAGSTVAELLRRGAAVRFFTNNSAARPVQVSAMLNHMGVPCQPDWVFGTAQLAASVCLSQCHRQVFVIGEEALSQSLVEAGVPVGEGGADAVVVGICRSVTYDLIDRAASAVRGGAAFLATNRDATYPLEGGRLQPGAGAIVAAIEVASGVSPVVLGKPMPELALAAMASAGVSPAQTLVIGDRLDTDIACGVAAGCDTFLVLTGVETQLPLGQSGSADFRGLL